MNPGAESGRAGTLSAALPREAVASRPDIKEKLSYGAGEVASNLSWNMATGFLLYYYTDVALLPVAALGTLMLLTRVFDAVIDPVVGVLVDRTRSRWGKTRPYLLFAAIPFGIACVATFSVPDISPTGKVVYAYITFTILGLIYSLLYVPYGAMLPMLSRDPADKTQLGSFRSAGTSIGSIFAYALVLPLVQLAGAGNERLGFPLAAGILASVTVALYLIVFYNCRERIVSAANDHHIALGRALKQMAANPTWQIVFIFVLIIFLRLGIMVSSLAFFTKDAIGQPWMMGVLLPLLSIAILSGTLIGGIAFRHVSKRAGNIAAILFAATVYLVMPYFEHRPAIFIALFLAANAIGGLQGITMFVLAADAVETQEKLYGNRLEGLLSASISFGMKVGFALGAASAAYTLAYAGYTPSHSTAEATRAIRWLFYGAPLALLLCQLPCALFFRDAKANMPEGQSYD